MPEPKRTSKDPFRFLAQLDGPKPKKPSKSYAGKWQGISGKENTAGATQAKKARSKARASRVGAGGRAAC